MIGQARRVLLLTCGVMLGIAVFFGAQAAHGDLQIAGYQDRLHDRFYVGSDKAFIGAGYNWSGVGRLQDPGAGGSNWKQLTMISDNYFITANHNKPVRGDDPAGQTPMVRFYRTDDPNGEYWESAIALAGNDYQGTRIDSSDLWVGKLASTPPSWVLRYPLAKRHEATNYLSYTDNDVYVFGQDSPRSLSSVRVGRNEISTVNSYGNLRWTYDVPGGLGADEAQTESGDSGGPSFFTSGRIPVLAGIHSSANYDTGVSEKLDKIMMAIGEPISFSSGLTGDVNGDFRVNIADLSIVGSRYGLQSPARFSQGDLNADGQVDFLDFIAVAGNYNRSLFAPADFDRDGDVDGTDLATIGSNWHRSVAQPFTQGDADGDLLVDTADLQIFDRNQYRAYFGALPAPLSPIMGDLTGNGIVDAFDVNIVNGHLFQEVVPGTNGDLNGNGVVDDSDLQIVTSALGDSFGDVDGDHVIGPGDFVILANNWNRSVTGGRKNGDLNGDGGVNSLDAKALFGWWSMKDGSFPGMMVPEPGTATLALAGLLAVAGPRRRWSSRRISVAHGTRRG